MLCLGDYEEPVALVPCGHAACRNCWHEAARHAEASCPQCRRPIEAVLQLHM